VGGVAAASGGNGMGQSPSGEMRQSVLSWEPPEIDIASACVYGCLVSCIRVLEVGSRRDMPVFKLDDRGHEDEDVSWGALFVCLR
jgi:hypothetical protein